MKICYHGPHTHSSHGMNIIFQVFIAAIAGYVFSPMVWCIASFMDACYIAHRNAITGPALEHFHKSVKIFHDLCRIFIEAGVQTTISLPHQHALSHFYYAFRFSKWSLFFNHRIKAYQGCEGTLVTFKPIPSAYPDALNDYADGQDCCIAPGFLRLWNVGWINIIVYGTCQG